MSQNSTLAPETLKRLEERNDVIILGKKLKWFEQSFFLMYGFLYHTKMLAYKPKSFTKELCKNSLSPGVTNSETEKYLLSLRGAEKLK